MNIKNMFVKFMIGSAIVVSSFSAVAMQQKAEEQAKPSDYYSFDADGNLMRPKNYRSWVLAGSVATPRSHDPKALFPDIQYIYIDPASYKYWTKHGEFPDGAILVKEIAYVSDTEDSPVGKGFFTGKYRSLSATIKSKERYPNTKGNWNYFNWTNKKEKKLNMAAAPLGAKCSACHEKNAPAGDGPFYNYFSVLRDAKGVVNTPENSDKRAGL